MSSEIVLNVEVRERTGTGGARQARREGWVPGVLYGGPRGSVPISIKETVLRKAINTGKFLSHLVTLEHKGERQPVIPRDVQFHPVTDIPMHVDLYRVEEGSIISIEVPVRFENHEKAPGLKRGGVLNIVRHAVELDCPAGAIPEAVIIDLAGREIGDSIHISAVVLPEGVRPTIKDRDFTIATVQGARVMVEDETPAAEAEDAEAEAAGEGEDEGKSED
ncbi:MAG: 50S ribosomal protein L25/general stress protein Ctc [Maricaulaceae bacterium]|nr:50S ribosomal protein L25/general stress protein Ctc [Maricaulaceae bacterium]